MSLVDGAFGDVEAEGIFGNKTDDHNSFENPEAVSKQAFTEFKVDGHRIDDHAASDECRFRLRKGKLT